MKGSIRETLSKTLFAACLLSKQSIALQCGINGVTKSCVRGTDIRYDGEIGYDLKDHNAIWNSLEGLYVEDLCVYTHDGMPIFEQYLSRHPKKAGLGSFNFCNARGFVNITVDGSRFYYERFFIAKSNGDGDEGLQNGFIYPSAIYATSTFEKDGVAKGLSSIHGFSPNSTIDENPPILTPVGGKSIIATSEQAEGGGGGFHQSISCADFECKEMNTYIENYYTNLDGHQQTLNFTRSSARKVKKSEWMKEWSKAYIEYNIPAPGFGQSSPLLNNPHFMQPFDPVNNDSTPKCSTICPSEDEWAYSDPYFNTSPYVQSALTGSFIIIIIIVVVAVMIIALQFIYRRSVDSRVGRVKEAMIKAIAQKMDISSLNAFNHLTPTELENMFEKIDVDNNGTLDKGEIRGLMEESVANMSNKDFNILFASIDLDGDGTLDFAEFCAFFTCITEADTQYHDDEEM